MQNQKLFSRDFTMVVIGQVISLFGNAILRYALPIYLLNQTHSAALFGAVSACAFIPAVLFAPIGGMVADRVNKRNVMVTLDFATAAIIAVYTLTRGGLPLVAPLVAVLMLLYGIQGAYQPTVQASLPVLAAAENLNSANAIINMVSSLSSLVGPVLGGVIYAAFGLQPILCVSFACFVFSAAMEMFIHIPFSLRSGGQNILKTAAADMRESLRFIISDKPIMLKMCLLACCINLVFSALITIGMPVVITEYLGFAVQTGNRLYGFAEGALALGGLIGGLAAGIAGARLHIRKSYLLIALCTLTLLPITAALALRANAMPAYIIIVLSCVLMMMASTIFSVEVITYAQRITPSGVLGKVMALLNCLSMCAIPIGQAVYGVLFEAAGDKLWLIFLGAFAACLLLAIWSKKVITEIEDI